MSERNKPILITDLTNPETAPPAKPVTEYGVPLFYGTVLDGVLTNAAEIKRLVKNQPAGTRLQVTLHHNDFAKAKLQYPDGTITQHYLGKVKGGFLLSELPEEACDAVTEEASRKDADTPRYVFDPGLVSPVEWAKRHLTKYGREAEDVRRSGFHQVGKDELEAVRSIPEEAAVPRSTTKWLPRGDVESDPEWEALRKDMEAMKKDAWQRYYSAAISPKGVVHHD